MRKYKFRTWHKELKFMNYNAQNESCLYLTLKDNNLEVMQYTGLKDKNGIDTFIDTFKIVWDIEKGGFMIEYLNCDEYYNLEEMPDCIVIGNIYE